MTLNLQEMLGGATIGGELPRKFSRKLVADKFSDTRALGVFIIRIQYAEDLSAQDRGNKSDPYIVLAYAKVKFTTRVL
jgi:Ca2+-dependent lipid-binding protein